MANHKFSSPNITEMLGVTPIALVTDEEIWTRLVTPQVKALLGDIVSSKVELRETVDGTFNGDEVTNFNDHRLYGGKQGFIRFPYIHSHYKTTYGSLVIKRDGTKFKVLGYVGNVEKGPFDLIFKVALRDRRFDGTARANDCSLVDFIGYEDPTLNHTLQIPGLVENATAVELSTYGFMPGSRIVDATGDEQLDEFVRNPYLFVGKPKTWLRLFKKAWKSKRSPGQNGNPVPDIARLVPNIVEAMAFERGYDYMENAPSHYHVAKWAESCKYWYSDPEQAAALKALGAGIASVKAAGETLTRPQESWLVAMQSLPKEFIPEKFHFGGAKWPQDNIGPENLWMYKPLSERAKASAAAVAAASSK
ncbi:hypothetical protein KF707_10500 [Candidatus Obscuribacterales bacterium]|jgi:hypothetical protein|nr:hypothetical protein [Candidatus Obscuribacterales bacterium]